MLRHQGAHDFGALPARSIIDYSAEFSLVNNVITNYQCTDITFTTGLCICPHNYDTLCEISVGSCQPLLILIIPFIINSVWSGVVLRGIQ